MLTLNRAEKLNALNAELVTALHRAIDVVAADRACRAVVLTGAGAAFCAGLDLKAWDDRGPLDPVEDPLVALDRQRQIAALTTRIHALPHPVIAAVNGAAAGGGLALALACDVRFAGTEAFFAASFIRAGYSGCDVGVSWLLPRIVGAGRAHEWMLTGRRFDAAEAERAGLLTQVVTAGSLIQTALDSAETIKLNPPASVSLTKQGMWLALETASLEATVELENRQQVLLGMTQDAREAREAFLGKRQPVYQRR
ncbi:enoyl-CoA hydratase/isomerase family protein [Aeromicrobium sp. CTD01-1L150]|uniref:enoyl-CoA hydratase/isomerase family protein n=1 Tax=Aeromicrobium sp. CTD01-1L150 TaxID=3341830 RepID=UPI0035C001CC